MLLNYVLVVTMSHRGASPRTTFGHEAHRGRNVKQQKHSANDRQHEDWTSCGATFSRPILTFIVWSKSFPIVIMWLSLCSVSVECWVRLDVVVFKRITRHWVFWDIARKLFIKVQNQNFLAQGQICICCVRGTNCGCHFIVIDSSSLPSAIRIKFVAIVGAFSLNWGNEGNQYFIVQN